MRTIGKRHHGKAGDYLSRCDECGAPELRSKLVYRADGKRYHPRSSCNPRLTAIELERGNAAGAKAANARKSGNTLR